MERVFVKSKAGLIIRDPVNRQVIPDGGKLVPRNTYWHRRILCGDVVVCSPPVKPSVRASAEKSIDKGDLE